MTTNVKEKPKANLSDWIFVLLCILIPAGLAIAQWGTSAIGVILGILILLPIYFAPSYIAYKNSKKQATAIYVLNFFLGWTFLGWVVALVWACMED